MLEADLAGIFSGADVVIHLAAITNAAAGFNIQEEVERVNFTGTERVARACVETSSPLIFASTTGFYAPQSAAVGEDCQPQDLQPQSPYPASELKASNC